MRGRTFLDLKLSNSNIFLVYQILRKSMVGKIYVYVKLSSFSIEKIEKNAALSAFFLNLEIYYGIFSILHQIFLYGWIKNIL